MKIGQGKSFRSSGNLKPALAKAKSTENTKDEIKSVQEKPCNEKTSVKPSDVK